MKSVILSFFFVISFFFFSCHIKVVPAHTEIVLGTVCTVNAFEKGTAGLYKELFELLRGIEQKMSVRVADSEISIVNAAAGKEAVVVSDETFYVVEQAVFFARESGGVFDPSVGPLVELWGIGGDGARVPSAEEISNTLKLVDWRLIELNTENKTIFLKKEGMALDVGGIAKGYAADILATAVKRAGIKRALIDLGGNIYAVGSRKDGTAWRIGIKNPLDPEGIPVLRVDVKSKSVVTSGMYERFFMQDGVRYHHILNTKTGYPVDNGTLSVTISSESSLRADAFSTSCFAMGEKDGIAFASRFEDIEAIYITNNKTVLASDYAAVKILDDSFSFSE